MPIFVSEGSSREWTPAPAGLHQGVCIDVVDLGNQEMTFAGKAKLTHRVRLWWALEEENPDNGGQPFRVMRNFTASLHEKATLRKFLETWRGREFSVEELERFDLETLIGVNAQIQVVHNKTGDRTYANVAAAISIGKGMTKMAIPDGYVRVKDRVTTERDGHVDESHLPDADETPF